MHENNGCATVRDWKVDFHLKRSCRDNFEGNIGRLLFTNGNFGNSLLLANILQKVSRHALLNVFRVLLSFQQLRGTVNTSANKIITERSKPTRSSLPRVRLLSSLRFLFPE